MLWVMSSKCKAFHPFLRELNLSKQCDSWLKVWSLQLETVRLRDSGLALESAIFVCWGLHMGREGQWCLEQRWEYSDSMVCKGDNDDTIFALLSGTQCTEDGVHRRNWLWCQLTWPHYNWLRTPIIAKNEILYFHHQSQSLLFPSCNENFLNPCSLRPQ